MSRPLILSLSRIMDEILSEVKTSRGRVTLRDVLRVRLLFGLYSGFSSSAVLRFLALTYSLFLAYFVTIVLLQIIGDTPILLMNFVPVIINYQINVLIAIVTRENDLFNYCKTIEDADKEMGSHHLPLLSRTTQYTFLFMCAFQTISTILAFAINIRLNFDKIFITVTIMGTAITINDIMNIIPLDLLRTRLVLLRHILALNLRRQNWSKSNLKYQIKTINNCLLIYKSLVHNLHLSYSWAKLRIFAKFLTSFILFMINGYNIISNYKNNVFSMKDLPALLTILVSSMLSCLPAVFAELIKREVDKLKIVIGNKLLECEDDEIRAALALAGEYLELRPFRLTFCRVCSLDASLVTAFAGLCTTYLILLIQITGLF